MISENDNDSSNHQLSNSGNLNISNVPKRNKCPTKNFLQDFRSIFINILVKEIGTSIHEYEIIKEIKKGVNRQKYLKLFWEKDFRHVWQQMFDENTHIKMLMETGVD